MVDIPSGAAVRATGGETVTYGTSSPGVNLLVSGGNLYADAGSTLVLNCTGSNALNVTRGVIGGAGMTVNQGNFVWMGGNVVGSLTNQSSQFTIQDTGGMIGVYEASSGTLTNAGTITHAAGATLYLTYGSTLSNLTGAVYDLQGNTYTGNYPNNASAAFNNAGLLRKSGSGTASISGVSFNNTGMVEVDSGTLSIGSYTQTAGTTDLNGGGLEFSSPAQILGGQLLGSGTINGSVVNIGGLLSPGRSPGSIILNGDYTEGTAGALLFELGGLAGGQFDFLDVNGTASLGGTLEISLLDGYHPMLGDSFRVMDFNSRTGDFDSIQALGASGFQFTTEYNADSLTLVTEAVPEPSTMILALAAAASLLLVSRCRRCRM